jgi:hypothetical protein
MFGWGPATRIYLAAGATDMRKGFEGLYGLALLLGGIDLAATRRRRWYRNMTQEQQIQDK